MQHRHVNAWAGTFATNVLILLIGLATGILSARLLAPDGRGALATVIFWPALFTSVGLMSLPAALIYRRGRSDVHRPNIAATAVCFCLVLAIFCVALGYAILPLVVSDPDILRLTRIFLIAFVPFNFLSLTLLAIDQSDLRYDRYNVFRLIPGSVYLLGLLALWMVHAVTVEAAVWIIWTGSFLTAVVRLGIARDGFKARPSLLELEPLMANAIRFHGGTIFALLFAQADRFAVILLWDTTTVGLYVVAFTLANAGLGSISTAFRELLFPHLAVVHDPAEQRNILGQILRYATLLLIPGGVAMAIVVPWVLPLLFGAAFSDAVDICLVLLCAYVPAAIRDIVGNGLRGVGEWKPCVVAESAALGIFVLAAVPLGWFVGVIGIPIALVIANCASIFYLLILLRHRFGLQPRDIWGLEARTIREAVHYMHGRIRDRQQVSGEN